MTFVESSIVCQGASSVGIPGTEIQPFELTAPPIPAPSPTDFLIAELLRHFGGFVVPVKKLEPVEIEIPVEPEDVSREAEPDWDRYRDADGRRGFRAQVAKLLWQRGVEAQTRGDAREARRLRKKALRFLGCNKCARPGVCSRYPDEHKFFIPNGCEVVFCKECADEVRRELLFAYQAVILGVIAKLDGVPEGWVLARINFTLRSDGSEITPERVKKFNGCVREAMVQAVGARKGYGMLFVDEVGFETRGHLPNSQRVAHGLNLHCHGLYLGPPLENRATCASCRSFVKKRKAEKKWDCFRCGSAVCDVKPGRLTQIFMEETRRAFGVESRGVWIKAVKKFAEDSERAVRWALHHMLKYLSKPPAVTPERLASLIAAFHTARRVHSLGLFYGEKPKGEKRNCPCPNCKAMGIVSAVSFEGRALSNGGCIPRIVPIKDLLARGYVPLREAGRDATLSMGISREESWGASP